MAKFAYENTSQELIQAIHRGALASFAVEQGDGRAQEVCRGIGDRTRIEAEAIGAALAAAGVAVGDPVIGDSESAQLHAVEWAVPDGGTAAKAVAALAPLGFLPWEASSAGAMAAISRLGRVMTAARTTDVTLAVRFRWKPRRLAALLPGALRPTAADYGTFDFSATAWPLYVLARPARLLAERLGRRTPAPASLGPFLSTPDDLLLPLLELAEAGPDDVLVDVGSGDGRLPIEAARHTGCRARGIEHDAALVSLSERRTAEAGLADRVTFEVGDAAIADLSDATIVFVFLPADVTARLIEPIRRSLRPGARIIAHEQHELKGAPPADQTVALMAGQGVTVAHRWNV